MEAVCNCAFIASTVYANVHSRNSMSGRVRRKLDIAVSLVDAFGGGRVLESRLEVRASG